MAADMRMRRGGGGGMPEPDGSTGYDHAPSQPACLHACRDTSPACPAQLCCSPKDSATICLRRANDASWRSILGECSDVFVKQHVEMMEALTGFETENKYSVFGPRRGPFPQGESLFAYETSGCINRNLCGPRRAFKMRIDSGGGPDAPALTLERPLRCGVACCCCALQEMHVYTGAGGKHGGLLVGSIRQRCACSPATSFAVYVGSDVDRARYTIQGPCLVMDNALCDTVFHICDPDGTPLAAPQSPNGEAEIRKLKAQSMSGWLQEAMSDADNFGCAFPEGATPADKATLLAAVFLIDFMFFESAGNGDSQRGRGRRRY